MVHLHLLLLPILLSGVLVFLVSSLIHMALPWHKNDYRAMPDQDKVQGVLRPFAISPGDYMLPRPSSMKDMRSPEFKEKHEKGPVIIATVLPNGQTGMGRSLLLWFLYALAVSFFAAYVAGRALPAGTDYLRVFRFVGTTAFLGYTLALWQMWIWYRRSLATTVKSTIDGLVYACLTAGVFGWLWPR